MRTSHEIDGQEADRFRPQAGPARRDRSLKAAPQTGAPQRAALTFSVRLLAAPEHHQDTAVLIVEGEIDLQTAPAVREALLPALEHRTGPVVVDLSEVAFMDSTAVHVLFETIQRLELEDRRLAIVCLEDGQVHQLLDVVGILDVAAVHRSRESALTDGEDLLRSEPEGPARRQMRER